MAENSAIEWTDHTFNPWEGCQKVGPGCDHCYAEARNARYVEKDHPAHSTGVAPNWGPGAPRRRTSRANWRKPLAWQRGAATFFARHARKQRVFCASLADVFDNAAPAGALADLFALIDATPDLIWLLLTKRIGNVKAMLAGCGREALPANVWLGATVVNQAEADRDVPKLLAAPAQVRFLSMEPLLGPVWLWKESIAAAAEALGASDDDGNCPGLDWIIVGGESGPGARPMHPDWARSLRDQCAAAEVPFLFKQWGEWLPKRLADITLTEFEAGRLPRRGEFPDQTEVMRVGKKVAGRLLDGVQHDGVPA